MNDEFPNKAKAGISENVPFPEIREEIPMESMSKSFDTHSRESIFSRRNLV